MADFWLEYEINNETDNVINVKQWFYSLIGILKIIIVLNVFKERKENPTHHSILTVNCSRY
jgi:hypothetical protein